MRVGSQSEKNMPECHYKTCENDADFMLTYDEQGTRRCKKPACREHKNTEMIHDPYNVKAEAI